MVQPLLVSISALTLATETVRSILKIDDVVRLNSTQLWIKWFRVKSILIYIMLLYSMLSLRFFVLLQVNTR